MRRLATSVLAALCMAWSALVGAAPRSAPAAVGVELPGKPTGPIVVEQRSGKPAVGVPLTVTVTARVDGNASGLSLEAQLTEPSAALLTAPVPLAADGGAYAWEITVVPLTADAGYLSIVVSGAIDGVDQARSITVSLRSSPSEAPAGEADGEAQIALPVNENP